jgi:Uma2 family endonuclease
MATAAENIGEKLLTAEEYGALGDLGRPSELIRGRIVEMNVPFSRHGQVCLEAAYIIAEHAKRNGLGHVLTNDSGVITERNPDTLRGADVAFYSFTKVPKGPFPRRGYLQIPPDLVVEVRSPEDRWSQITTKVAEYLNVGVQVVIVLDPDNETAQVHYPDKPPRILSQSNELALPEVLGDFHVSVKRFFE